LDPIWDYLNGFGYKFEGQHLVIEGWPVEFLPADDPLYNDALLSAIEVEMDGTKTWVMTQEHLMAIALRTGRAKDLLRLQQFVSLGSFDEDYLQEILVPHKLSLKWEELKRAL
jgi:hypothetical protein